ncbi:hypothetical protein BGZ91_003148 [Linnemannia elongata]|nr:hypothetical protein BGZ91_003148 [Linnemannia elongata]
MKHTSAQTFTTLSVAVLMALLATSVITPDLGSVVVQAAPLPFPQGSYIEKIGSAATGLINAAGGVKAAGSADAANLKADGTAAATGTTGSADAANLKADGTAAATGSADAANLKADGTAAAAGKTA